jgi:hypothetical protein
VLAAFKTWPAPARPAAGYEHRLLTNYNDKPLLTRPQQRFYTGALAAWLIQGAGALRGKESIVETAAPLLPVCLVAVVFGPLRLLSVSPTGCPFSFAPLCICFMSGTEGSCRRLLSRRPAGPNYLEIDLDVHNYAYIARKAFHSFISRLAPVVFENAFVVQGKWQRPWAHTCQS